MIRRPSNKVILKGNGKFFPKEAAFRGTLSRAGEALKNIKLAEKGALLNLHLNCLAFSSDCFDES